METLVLRRDSNSTVGSSEKENEEEEQQSSFPAIPAWKLPLTSALLSKAAGRTDSGIHNSNSNNTSNGNNNKTVEETTTTKRNNKRDSMIPVQAAISPELAEDEATAQLIQILLPCIICNRTFSPEALERHSKVCSQVNLKDPRRPARGKFNSAEMRKKNTELEDYIPPPDHLESNFVRKGSCRLYRENAFVRNSPARATIGATSSVSSSTTSSIPTWRKKSRLTEKPAIVAPEPFENLSEFGSEDSNDSKRTLPSYAQPLSPTDTCPFCGRNFSVKAYDRHVKFCQEIHERKQYETQPIPKEKEEALERQEIRTKYKPLKSSTSCGSLRSSVSPGRDFSSMAMKLYGFMNKTWNKNFKKSNESLAASCYGDYARNIRRTSPAPSVASSIRPAYKRANTTIIGTTRSPMGVNTSSNIPKRTKSIENMNAANNTMTNSYVPNYNHVPSSGYGQQYINSGNFNRNAKLRSSLHKNFFLNSSKRVEPEGTENTTPSSNATTPTSTNTVPGELIITPMSLYSKGKIPVLAERQNKSMFHSNSLHHGNGNANNNEDYRKPGLLSADPTYDPYEKAARQFEELLKTQVKSHNQTGPERPSRTQGRKVGLDRALRSVTEPYTRITAATTTEEQQHPATKKDPFVFNLADDSYWDQILNRKRAEPTSKSTTTMNTNTTTLPETGAETKGTDGDNNSDGKSRAVSNISSSVDSAFSRSDGADLEFEALESLVGVRESSPPPPKSSNRVNDGPTAPMLPPVVVTPVKENPSAQYPSFASPLSTYQPRSSSMAHENSSTPSTPSLPTITVKQEALGLRSQTIGRESSDDGKDKSNSSFAPTPAKFCHECGMLYPTPTAKFCPECGERRVMK